MTGVLDLFDLAVVLVVWSPTLPDSAIDGLEDLVHLEANAHGGDPGRTMAGLLCWAMWAEHADRDDLRAACVREITDQIALGLIGGLDAT